MLALPVEVICGGILPHLSVCDLQALDTAFTNKYLRPQLQQVWKSYQYDSLEAVLNRHDAYWLSRIGVRIISFTPGEDTTESDLMKNIPALKRLRITSKVKCTNIIKLASNTTGLEYFHADCLYGPNTDNAVSALAQNCRQLHTLHLRSNDVTDAGISAVAQYCCVLDTLRLVYCKITDAGIQALCDNCPHLKHVELSSCHSLTDASLIAIANSYPHLESINFDFTDDALICFADKCHELRCINIRGRKLTSRGLNALWASNPNLMEVDIVHNEFISDDDIMQLVQCCPLLQKLSIFWCKQISDAAVIAVAEHCPQLRSLNISHRKQMSDASLIALGQHCHTLKSINVSYLNNISDVGIAALAAGCPLLQEFYAISTDITDAGVIALARGCRDLRIIGLNQCKSVGIGAVSAIAENYSLISELYFYKCSNVDDACLYSIAQHCRNLTVLCVTLINVSDVSCLQAVVTSCKMLRRLECSHHINEYDKMISRIDFEDQFTYEFRR